MRFERLIEHDFEQAAPLGQQIELPSRVVAELVI